MRALAAEITREKLFERLHDELPYQSTVETELWKDLPNGSARVEQTIYVTREGQKKIVIGEGGRTIKSIGQAARKEIIEAAEQNIHLFLFVKVREHWGDDPERYREMGLEFPKSLSLPTATSCPALCRASTRRRWGRNLPAMVKTSRRGWPGQIVGSKSGDGHDGCGI